MKYNSKVKSALNKLEIPEDEHKAFLVAHAQAFEMLSVLLQRDLDELAKSVYSKSLYDKPNWDYRQADLNGQYRQLVLITELLED